MKKIILPLIVATFSQLGIAQCNEPFTVPYTAAIEDAVVPALPYCMESNYIAFASDEVFESIAGPVAGFDGKLLAYDTYTGSPGGGAMQPTIGAELYTNRIHLVQGVQYVVSYRYGNSDPAKTIGRFGVQLVQPETQHYDDLATHLNVTGATPVDHTTTAFTVPETADYYIKFDAQSFENQGLFYLDNISVQEMGVMGMGDNLLSRVAVWPNPTSGRLAISNPQPGRLEIYTITGQLLRRENMEGPEHQTDISSLAAGMYILTIYSGEQVEKVKIYKN